MIKFRAFGYLLGMAVCATPMAAPDDGRLTFREQGFTMAVTARTPDQIAAFYSARGFPRDAVQRLTQACFITVSMRNETGKVVWLEPEEWRIVDRDGHVVNRITRQQWDQLWETMNLPEANRATFGWTQLPDQRDLQPGEAVGGNITLVRIPGEFALTARFSTGQDRKGGVLSMQVPRLKCALDRHSS